MRVLNIAMRATFTEGYTYQDNLLTEYQHKLGHDVILLTTTQCRGKDGEPIQVSACDKVMENGVRLIRIKPENKYLQILGYYRSIGKIINRLKPNLIFIHGLSNFIPLYAITYKKKNPDTVIVVDNHQDCQNSKTSGFPFAQLLFLWRTCWKIWIKYVNHVFGTTSWRKEFVVDYFGIPKEKVDVLMLGADTDKFPKEPIEVRNSIRRELGIIDSDLVYIHGGKMNKNKKTLEVIRAFNTLGQSKVKLILFGSVSDDIKVDFNKEISQNSSIIYLGYIDARNCHKYFFASDFAVFPGLHSVLWEESIACGLPGVYGKYTENDHINICGNCVQLDLSAGMSDIARVMQSLNTNNDYFMKMKEAAKLAAKSLSYYDIARKSLQS